MSSGGRPGSGRARRADRRGDPAVRGRSLASPGSLGHCSAFVGCCPYGSQPPPCANETCFRAAPLAGCGRLERGTPPLRVKRLLRKLPGRPARGQTWESHPAGRSARRRPPSAHRRCRGCGSRSAPGASGVGLPALRRRAARDQPGRRVGGRRLSGGATDPRRRSAMCRAIAHTPLGSPRPILAAFLLPCRFLPSPICQVHSRLSDLTHTYALLMIMAGSVAEVDGEGLAGERPWLASSPSRRATMLPTRGSRSGQRTARLTRANGPTERRGPVSATTCPRPSAAASRLASGLATVWPS